jgi:periplasmic copper chaperone A
VGAAVTGRAAWLAVAVLSAGVGAGVGLSACGGEALGSASVDGIVVTDAGVTEGDRITAGYLRVTAGETGDRLVGATSPVATRVSLHVTGSAGSPDDGAMVEVSTLEVPPGGEAVLAPGGDHLMFEGLVRPLSEGERVTLQLEFASGTVVDLDAPVIALVDALDTFDGG